MARMSAESRLELGDKMVESWTAAGHGQSKSCLFVQDMLVRMRSGKGMSPKQREWYDSVVVTPPPQLQNENLVQRLKDAKTVVGMESHTTVLDDFAYRVGRGYSLTDKQLAFMNGLLDKADNLKVNGPWIPNEEEKEAILQGINLCKRYSSYYLGGRPGLSKAIHAAIKWQTRGLPLDQRDAAQLIKVCKGERAAMKKFTQKYPIGSLVADRWGRMVLVMCEPFSRDSDGQVVINILVDGQVLEIYYKDIKEVV